MLEAALHVLIVVPAAALLLLPGAALLGAVGAWRHLPTLSWLPAAFSATLLLALPIAGLRLYLHEPIWLTPLLLSLLTVGFGWISWRRHGTPSGLVDQMNWRAVAGWGGWLAMIAAVAAVIGTVLNNDSSYHIGVVQRMLAMPEAGFHVTVRHPSAPISATYAMPLWHEMMAATAWLSGRGAIETVRIIPAVLAPLSVLAVAGAARAWFGRGPMPVLTAAAFGLVSLVMTPPDFEVISVLAYPGFVTLYLVLPVLLTVAHGAVWSDEPAARRAARTSMALLILLTAALHANYIVYVGLALGGYAILWLIRGLRRLCAPRQHVIAGVWALGAAGLSFVSVYPLISRLDRFARGTGEAGLGSTWERLGGVLFEGTASSFHLYPGQLMAFGGAAIAGMLGLCLLTIRPQLRGMWLYSGFAAAILAISLVDQLFAALLALGNSTVAFRIFRVLPVEIGLAALFAIPASFICHGMRPPLAWAGLGVAALVTAAATYRWQPAVGELSSRPHPAWPVQTVALILLGALIVFAYRSWAARRKDATEHQDPWLHGSARVTLIALAAMLIGLAPQLLLLADDVAVTAKERIQGYPRGGYPRSSPTNDDPAFSYPTELVRAVGKLPPGSVVMSDPVLGWDVQAFGPVYGAADYKRISQETLNYGPGDRYWAVRGFWDEQGHDERLWMLHQIRPDILIIHIRRECNRTFYEWFAEHIAGPVRVAGPGLPPIGGRIEHPQRRWKIIHLRYPPQPQTGSSGSAPINTLFDQQPAPAAMSERQLNPSGTCLPLIAMK